MHLDDGQIQQLVHDELEDDGAREHAARCPVCAARAAEAARDDEAVAGLLRHLDHDPPRVQADDVVARASRRNRTALRRAAGVVLALGAAGAAWAAPGSPLPGWIERASGSEPAVDTPALPVVPAPGPGSGLGVAAEDPLTIEIATEAAHAVATVSLTDADQVRVRTRDGHARFSSHPDRLAVQGDASARTFHIEVPRSAPHVEIVSGGRRLLVIASGIVTGGTSSTDGTWTVQLNQN